VRDNDIVSFAKARVNTPRPAKQVARRNGAAYGGGALSTSLSTAEGRPNYLTCCAHFADWSQDGADQA